MEKIDYSEFEKVDLCSGTIVKVELFPEARKPAYKIFVDFGSDFGIKQTSAQITVNYTPESLLGKQVVCCVNLGVKKIAGFESQFLLTGFPDEQGNICITTIDSKVPNGQKLY